MPLSMVMMDNSFFLQLTASSNVFGNSGWTEYTSSQEIMPSGLTRLQIDVGIAPNTTGTFYFDDVVIEVNE